MLKGDYQPRYLKGDLCGPLIGDRGPAYLKGDILHNKIRDELVRRSFDIGFICGALFGFVVMLVFVAAG